MIVVFVTHWRGGRKYSTPGFDSALTVQVFAALRAAGSINLLVVGANHA